MTGRADTHPSSAPPTSSAPWLMAPRSRNHRTNSPASLRCAASRGVHSSQGGSQLMSAPLSRRYSAHRKLAAVTRTPEGSIDRLLLDGRCAGEVGFDAIHQPERRGVCKCRLRTTLDQPVRCSPLPEPTCVRERGTATDDRAVGLHVGAGIDERVERSRVRRRPEISTAA